MPLPFKCAEDAGAAQRFRRGGSITLQAVERLLAEAACVQDVSHDSVQRICEARRVDFQRRLLRGRRRLYRRYLEHCFADKELSEQENAELEHLRALLCLSVQDVAPIHDQVAVEVYGEAVEEVLADFQLDDAEAAFLARLREQLSLPETEAERIYGDRASSVRRRAMSEASRQDHQFIEHRPPAGEFIGRSEGSLEDAIGDALAKAQLAVPQLHWFEVTELAGYVTEGKPRSWHVTLRAGIRDDG